MVRTASYVVLFFLLLVQHLDAILDGRTAPIYLDTRYTFTNYEWARGSVFFRQGFDVPPAGTVLLGIDGGLVAANINLKGGTVRLERDIVLGSDTSLTGSGFIDMKFKKIIFSRASYPGLFAVGSYVKFLSTGTIEGSSRRALVHFFDMVVDLRSISGDFFFNELSFIIFSNKLLLTTSNPNTIKFSNCDIIHGALNTVFFNNPIILLGQNTNLTTVGGFVFNGFNIDENSNVVLQSGSKITTNTIDLKFNTTRLTLNNSTLEFTSSGTASIAVGSPTAAQGSMLLNGRCNLRSLNGNKLVVNPTMRINFLPGCRLSIDNSTHLVVQG